jgi:multidrug resistance efflux pump
MPAASRFSPLVWLLGLGVLLGSAVGTSRLMRPPTPGEQTAPGGEADVAFCEGHVDSLGGVTALHPAQTGRVVEVMARENDRVKAGAELLRVDPRPAKLRREEAAAVLKAAEVQLESAKTLVGQYPLKVRQQEAAVQAAVEGRAMAEEDCKGHEKLAGLKQVSAEALASARARVRQARAVVAAEQAKLDELKAQDRAPGLAVARARAEADAARARRRQAVQAVRECTLRAPQAGTVLRVQTGVGDLIAVPPLKPAVLFCPDDRLIVRAELAQEFAGGVREGLSAVVKEDAGAGSRSWRGQVTHVSRWFARQRSVLLEPGQVNDVRTLECIITLDDGRGHRDDLRIGQRVHVIIHKKKDAR